MTKIPLIKRFILSLNKPHKAPCNNMDKVLFFTLYNKKVKFKKQLLCANSKHVSTLSSEDSGRCSNLALKESLLPIPTKSINSIFKILFLITFLLLKSYNFISKLANKPLNKQVKTQISMKTT